MASPRRPPPSDPASASTWSRSSARRPSRSRCPLLGSTVHGSTLSSRATHSRLLSPFSPRLLSRSLAAHVCGMETRLHASAPSTLDLPPVCMTLILLVHGEYRFLPPYPSNLLQVPSSPSLPSHLGARAFHHHNAYPQRHRRCASVASSFPIFAFPRRARCAGLCVVFSSCTGRPGPFSSVALLSSVHERARVSDVRLSACPPTYASGPSHLRLWRLAPSGSPSG
ncbi:hypothetical protein V8E36_005685 [Tilletia maclaganii]